ncbi:hypothetical protein HOG98_03475 [bacterium]|jgi:hypothetical protein|nr:hypothetical protein [bacterium]
MYKIISLNVRDNKSVQGETIIHIGVDLACLALSIANQIPLLFVLYILAFQNLGALATENAIGDQCDSSGFCQNSEGRVGYWDQYQDRINFMGSNKDVSLEHKIQTLIGDLVYEAAIFPIDDTQLEIMISHFNRTTYSDFKEIYRRTHFFPLSDIRSTFIDDKGLLKIDMVKGKKQRSNSKKVKFTTDSGIANFKPRSRNGVLEMSSFEFFVKPFEEEANALSSELTDMLGYNSFIGINLNRDYFGGVFAQTFLTNELGLVSSKTPHYIYNDFIEGDETLMKDRNVSYLFTGDLTTIENGVSAGNYEDIDRQIKSGFFSGLDEDTLKRVSRFIDFRKQYRTPPSFEFRTTLFPKFVAELNSKKSLPLIASGELVVLITPDDHVLDEFQDQMTYWSKFPSFPENHFKKLSVSKNEKLTMSIETELSPLFSPEGIKFKNGDVFSIGVIDPGKSLISASIEGKMDFGQLENYHRSFVTGNGLDSFFNRLLKSGIVPIVINPAIDSKNHTLSEDDFNSALQKGDSVIFLPRENGLEFENTWVLENDINRNLGMFKTSNKSQPCGIVNETVNMMESYRSKVNKIESSVVSTYIRYTEYLDTSSKVRPNVWNILSPWSSFGDDPSRSWNNKHTFAMYSKMGLAMSEFYRFNYNLDEFESRRNQCIL